MIDIPSDFHGVVSVSTGAEVEFERACGLADRAHGIGATPQTRFAIASAMKGFTTLAVAALVEDGVLTYDSAVRPVLGADLPLIADDVTVGHLLAHRSGIGDYLDEDSDEDQLPRVPVQALDSTEAYLPALDGFPAKFPAGTRFSYCNSGFVVLALVAERASGVAFGDLAERRVWAPAGMASTAFMRSDRLPGDTALGYLEDGRTNVFELPVVGSGDGGAYSTVADVRAFWLALFAGRIVAPSTVERLTAIVTPDTGKQLAYGLGFWLGTDGQTAVLEGADRGVSFRSWHAPATGRTATVVSNTSDGAWPLAKALARTVLPISGLRV